MVFDGGDLALDFLNTVALPSAGRDDLLGAPDSLVDWLGTAGLATDEALLRLRRSPPECRVLMADAQRLREAVAGIVNGLVSGAQAPALAVMEVNRVLEARSSSMRLKADGGRYHLAPVHSDAGPLALLAPVAEAAAKLLGEADPARLRQCDAEECALWFLDTSRNGRRRWCSMARCGNRAKVAAHYRRKRPQS